MDDTAPQTKQIQTGPMDRRQKHALFWVVLTGGTPCQCCMWHDWCAKNRATCEDWHHYVETGEITEGRREPKENTI